MSSETEISQIMIKYADQVLDALNIVQGITIYI